MKIARYRPELDDITKLKAQFESLNTPAVRPTMTLSTQGNISIPKRIREEHGLEPGQQFIVRWEDGKVTFEPVATELPARCSKCGAEAP